MLRRLKGYQAFLRTCWHYVGGDRMLFVVFIGLSVVGALTEAIGIGLFVPLLDMISNKPAFAGVPFLSKFSDLFNHIAPEWRVKIMAIMILGVVLTRALVQYLVQKLSVHLPAKIEQRLRNESFDALLGMDIGVVNRSKSGSLINFVSSYPSRIGQVMGHMASLTSNLALLIIYAGLMILVSPIGTVLSLVFLAAVFYLQRSISSGPLRQASADVTSSAERLGQTVVETLSGLSLIRLSVASARVASRYRESTALLRSAQNRYAVASALIGPLFTATSGILICAILLATSLEGRETAPAVTAALLFLFLLQRLITPVTSITLSRNAIILHMDAISENESWMDRARRHLQRDGDKTFERLTDGIRFNSVTFSYDEESGDALKDVSFFIPKGKMTAIVGPSGAGKSTVVALLGRLYDPQGGAVEIDGVDLREYKANSWRKTLSVVSQSIFLLNDTVERNLAFSLDRTPTSEECRQAALSSACDFIDSLPDGYQTMLGERGTRLSGGQQQRLAIARAVLANPQLLILDEATSNLDSIAEHAVQRAMAMFGRGRTRVVIAHRLATIKRADNIIVLEEGRVIEQGKHDELVAARGRYWEMINLQRLDILDVPETVGAI